MTRLSDWLRRLKEGEPGKFGGRPNGGRPSGKRVGTIVSEQEDSFPDLVDAASSDNALRRWGRC